MRGYNETEEENRKEELLDHLRQFAEELGREPTRREMTRKGPHSSATYQERFGSWNDAKRLAFEEDYERS